MIFELQIHRQMSICLTLWQMTLSKHGFSIKSLERTILNSRAYQLSSLPNDSNRHDTVNYSRYYLRRMSAEQLMDAIVQVTGVEERFTGWPPGTRAMQIPHGAPTYLLTAFGRVADREFAQERKEDPSITQILASDERRHC